METKEVHVKAHIRVIKQKAYRFVCKKCNKVVERICYPSLPLYCEQCRPPKSSSTKPSPKPILFPKRRRAKPSVSSNNDMEIAVGE